MFLVFWFLRFLCKFAFLRTRGGNKEWFFHRFFCIDPHYVTMTKIESRDFALIFLGKRPFNTLSKMELLDIVIVTMDFYLHSAQEMISWNSQCHIYSTDRPTSTDKLWPAAWWYNRTFSWMLMQCFLRFSSENHMDPAWAAPGGGSPLIGKHDF